MNNKDIKSNADLNCRIECDKKLRECLRKGEDEPICRIKTAPCYCNCK